MEDVKTVSITPVDREIVRAALALLNDACVRLKGWCSKCPLAVECTALGRSAMTTCDGETWAEPQLMERPFPWEKPA